MKIKDQAIVAKWKQEVGAEAAEKFEYALKECWWCAENFEGPARPAAELCEWDGIIRRIAFTEHSNDVIQSHLPRTLLIVVNSFSYNWR